MIALLIAKFRNVRSFAFNTVIKSCFEGGLTSLVRVRAAYHRVVIVGKIIMNLLAGPLIATNIFLYYLITSEFLKVVVVLIFIV